MELTVTPVSATSPAPSRTFWPSRRVRQLQSAQLDKMASLANKGPSAAKSVTASMRALSLATSSPSLRPAVRPSLPTQQARCLSQALLASPAGRPSISPLNYANTRTEISAEAGLKTGAAILQKQQTRGMKVHSSVKKRCEHCKVSQNFTCVKSGTAKALPLFGEDMP